MRSERGKHRHPHVAPVANPPGAFKFQRRVPSRRERGYRYPVLLRMSVPARLVMVAAASLLLWVAVAWALS